MTPYKSKSGKDTGVTAFEAGKDYILVRFGDAQYKYTYQSAGKSDIDQMKTLAKAQQGLSSFISRNKPGYEKRSS